MRRILAVGRIACLLAGIATTVAAPAFARQGPAARPGPIQTAAMPTSPVAAPGRLHDQAWTRDQELTRDQIGISAGNVDDDRMRDRDQDRLHITQNVNGQLHSLQMLTQRERLQMRDRLRRAAGDPDRGKIRSEYQRLIRDRARDLGVDAPFGPRRGATGDRDGYQLAQMLSDTERLQFHQRLRGAGTDQERARIRTEMQTMARDRARGMGIDLPEWYGERVRSGRY
jgi:hypothetical protein